VLKPAILRLAFALTALPALLPAHAPAQTSGQNPNAEGSGGRVVLVLPFDNRSGQPTLNWIGDSFPDTLNQRLTSAGFLTITRDDRLFALEHLGLPPDFRPSRATTIRMAQTLDADYVIVGSYSVAGETAGARIQVQAQVLEVNKLRLSTPIQDSADLARLFDVENALAWKICRQVEPHFAVAVQTFLAASSGIRLTAFENYIRGTSAPTPTERVKRLQSAVKDAPSYTAAQLALGKELYADREFDQAAAALAKVPRTDRLALEANFFIGLARFNSAKYATALFQRASATDPNDADYHYNLAISHLHQGDFANALREVDLTLKLRPTDGEAVQLRALISAGRATSSTRPSGFEPTTRLRRTYSEAGFRQAAFALDQMRTLRLASQPPAQQAAEYTRAASEYLGQGLLPEAEQEFQAAILADPASSAAHAGLAQVRQQSGSASEARTEAETSLRLAPNVNAYLVLARIDLQASDLANASLNVQKALHLEPANAAALGMRQAIQARGQTIP
jgi:tetratricopeptide (TPR) repeat protein